MANEKKFMGENSLLYLWNKVKGIIPKNVSELSNDSGFQNATEVNAIVTGKGYQTASQVKSAVESYGYQNGTQVKSTVEGYGYQNANQVENAIVSKGYQNANQVATAINNAISGITGISFEVVSALPTTGETGVIYLLSNDGSGQNVYDEYIWVNSKFEFLGTTQVDLSNYLQDTDLVEIGNARINEICK